MKIELYYYKLLSDKKLGDNSIIPQDNELTLLKKDENDGMLFFEAHIDENKKLFWANKDDVEFIRSSTKDWSEDMINERNKYINGEYL